jgi:hypothetical protein
MYVCMYVPYVGRRYIWATLFLGDINTETWPSRLRESQELEQNMVLSPVGLRFERDSAGEDQQKQ